MRLHWFLSRVGKSGERKKPGRIRRMLKLLGPTWEASPLRRTIQTLFLVFFLYLLFVVCWPYTASPVRVWHGWFPVNVDAETGQVTATADNPPAVPIEVGMVLHAIDACPEADPEDNSLGSFKVINVGEELQLEPAGELPPGQLDWLAASFGPWTLSEDAPDKWPSHYADNLQAKEPGQAELFLAVDPLVSISTSLASRTWVWSLSFVGAMLLVCLVVPRGFCGYVCPLGTLIDVFDWAVGRRVKLLHVSGDGWWVHIKYFLLLAVLVSSLFGVLISGFVAAIPVVTRGLVFIVAPLQLGLMRDWHQVPPLNAGHWISIGLFLAIFALGFFSPRFWCKYVCPSGAIFSIANLLRLTGRKVQSNCVGCKRCVEVCPFDAIREDYTTRYSDCTFCQTCGGSCPVAAIQFTGRFAGGNFIARETEKETGKPIQRRSFLSTAAGVAAGVIGGTTAAAAIGGGRPGTHRGRSNIVRPPGSVGERKFLRLCIRCGECMKACPNNVLQPLGAEAGVASLWTPYAAADWAGCEPSCNACGQVCPTGAIRALPLEEKRAARMGLAAVNRNTCLPMAGVEACQLCHDECQMAGYKAIEFQRVRHGARPKNLLEAELEGDVSMLAPVVLAEKCVGCGLCQSRCYAINVKEKKLLKKSAIVVEAGRGKDDRMCHGSYVELRKAERQKRETQRRRQQHGGGDDDRYLLDFMKEQE